MEFTDVGADIAALVGGVVQANLRAIQELSRVNDPQGLMDLQRRFAIDYIAALQHGTTRLLNACKPDAL